MKRDSAAVSCWTSWCEKLWAQGESSWIERDGQDHYYRDKVVVPALIASASRSFCSKPQTLVDLGSGDGYTTGLFLAGLERSAVNIASLVLIDRSQVQLELAARNYPLAIVSKSDLDSSSWISVVAKAPVPRLFISIFVLQEMPILDPFLVNLSAVMSPGDLCMTVIVAPSYSEYLRRKKSLEVVCLTPSSVCDWEWAGQYPISTPSGDIFLPHFQRSISIYRRAFEKRALRLVECTSLSVPPTIESRKIFDNTIYGQGIIGRKSSVLFLLTKTGDLL